MVMYEFDRSNKNEYLYHQNNQNLEFIKHTHKSYEIVFCLDGELFCEVDNKKYVLKKGNALLILPGHIHSYTTNEYSKSYLCVFSTDWVNSFYKITKDTKLSNILLESHDSDDIEILTNDKINPFIKKGIFYKICGKIFEQSEMLPNDSSYFLLTNSLSLYIENNFTKDIKLKNIAKEFGYDYSYLSTFFNHNFGMDFSSYINKYRIQYATSLLESSIESITEIAFKSGFSTIRNFNRVFKEETGFSPREYRINYLSQQPSVKKKKA